MKKWLGLLVFVMALLATSVEAQPTKAMLGWCQNPTGSFIPIRTALAGVQIPGYIAPALLTGIGTDGNNHVIQCDNNGNIIASSSTTATNITGGTTGSLPYQSAAGATAMLAPNITTTKCFLQETGTGSAGLAPGCAALVVADIPSQAALGIARTLFSVNTNQVVNNVGTTETLLFQGTIPAGTVDSTGHLKWTAAFEGQTSVGTCTFKMYLNANTSIPGGIAAYNGGALATGPRNQNASGDTFVGSSLSNQGSNYVFQSTTTSGSANNVQASGINLANASYWSITATPGTGGTDATGCILSDFQLIYWP